jgi:integrase
MPRIKLTPGAVKNAAAPMSGDRLIYWDEAMPGFGLCVTADSHRSYVYQYRAAGVSRRMVLDGSFLAYEAKREEERNKNGGRNNRNSQAKPSKSPLEAARREAEKVKVAVKDGRDPLLEMRKAHAADSNSLRNVAEEFFTREGKNMRSIDERRAIFRRHIFERFGARPIDSIRRSEIARLLNKVADGSGPVAAGHVLVALRRLFNWHATRDDDFLSPIVRGMLKRTSPPRDRVLSDDELRIIWTVAQQHRGPYDYLVQFILLTATRLREAAEMNRAELSVDGSEWIIPGARYKTKLDHLVPLSSAAQTLLADMPKIGRRGWVFTTDGETPISGFSKFKAAFDRRVLGDRRPEAAPLPRWTTHDLRRTARTLMARQHLHIPSDHAERALGHVMGGVKGTYNRHDYKQEKRDALEKLAAEIERIVSPPQNNVVPLAARQG